MGRDERWEQRTQGSKLSPRMDQLQTQAETLGRMPQALLHQPWSAAVRSRPMSCHARCLPRLLSTPILPVTP